jgi:maltose/moltooligosaccharide transporter
MKKPKLTLAQIINMSVGFLGIQFGFALQNGNASRILQKFGADVEHLNLFWLAAPLTGMIVQPIIGYFSDKTWGRLGRRRPYFLAGAILASTALLFLPNAGSAVNLIPPLIFGAVILTFMDASFNVSMEPFRALVADNLPDEQNTSGFAVQTVLIGIGAVLGGFLPLILNKYFGVSNESPAGVVQDNVVYSFYIGAAVFMGAILWTVFTTKEYSPQERKKFGIVEEETHSDKNFLVQFIEDFKNVPKPMLQMGLVQFFSWIALFSMWVYSTPAIAHHVYELPLDDKSSKAYNSAGDWVSSLFAIYNGVSALYAMFLPTIAAKLGRKRTHALSLIAGGLGLISIYFAPNPNFLIISMVGVGMAWASILAMPYAILAANLPSHKMGIYMGIFNFFITFPQIVNGIFGGIILTNVYGGNPIYVLVVAGVMMLLAAFSVRFVQDTE